jgi:GAF domain-containing protein/HAMP domain-containing protein
MDSNGVYVTGIRLKGGDIGLSQRDELLELLEPALSGTGANVTGIVFERDGPIFYQSAVAIPMRGPAGEVIGAMLAARIVNEELLQEISRRDVHLAIVADGDILVEDLPSPEILSEFSDVLVKEPYAASGVSRETIVADDLLRSADGNPYALAHSPFEEEDASIAILVDMSELNLFQRQLMLTTAGVVGSLALVMVLVVSLFARGSIVLPISKLRSAAEQMASGDYQQLAEVKTQDEVGQLASAFNHMAVQLRQTLESLQQRSADLERRSIQLQASAEVARRAISILDIDRLIQQVVDLIRDRFDLYYVGLFLLDAAGGWAVLQAGTGEAGQAMLARGHRIKTGEGMIGWCIDNAQARLAKDASEDDVRATAQDLPDTRSELALPLRSRDRVFGALSIQSTQLDAFDEPTIAVLQIMADQVAAAIDNARLYAESQAALEAERRAYGELSAEAWGDLLRVRADWGYRYDRRAVSVVEGRWSDEMREAERTGQTVIGHEGNGSGELAIPIRVRGKAIGVLRFGKRGDDAEWTPAEVTLLETLTDRMGQSLEGARLYQDTQRRVVRERLIGEVTGRIRESLDMETVLRTAVDRVQEALGLDRLVIRLMAGEDGDSPQGRT